MEGLGGGRWDPNSTLLRGIIWYNTQDRLLGWEQPGGNQ